MIVPHNVRLPFFTYGLFKPGQLAFFQIKKYIEESPKNASINGYLKERDGIPLLGIDSNCGEIQGKLVKFKDGCESDAYRKISELKPFKIYEWQEILLKGDIKANALIGKKIEDGTIDIEGNQWYGENDPYFKEALTEIDKIIKENSEFDEDYQKLFRLQMAFGLLWVIIERYTGFRYNFSDGGVLEKVMHIVEEEQFIKSLKNQISNNPPYRSVVNASDPTKKYELNPSDPKQCVKYYYQIRSNMVHRGKGTPNDFHIINQSLKELFVIFKEVLTAARSTNNEII